jgi:multisubunit Na+/H+ antiporter MnhF subunit
VTPLGPLARAVAVPALWILGLGIVMCLVRLARGPSSFDRALAFDGLVLNVVGAVLLLSMLLATDVFVDAVLVVTLLGFVGTVALAAYLEGSLVD